MFGGELVLRQLLIQSINKFTEKRDQNSLEQGLFLQCFTQVPEVDNCIHNYQTQAANKSNLKEFSYRTERFKYSLFLFCVSESKSLKNSMPGAKSIKHFKSMLVNAAFHIIFTLF